MAEHDHHHSVRHRWFTKGHISAVALFKSLSDHGSEVVMLHSHGRRPPCWRRRFAARRRRPLQLKWTPATFWGKDNMAYRATPMVSFFGDISGYLFNGGRLVGGRELWESFMTQISNIDIDKFWFASRAGVHRLLISCMSHGARLCFEYHMFLRLVHIWEVLPWAAFWTSQTVYRASSSSCFDLSSVLQEEKK